MSDNIFDFISQIFLSMHGVSPQHLISHSSYTEAKTESCPVQAGRQTVTFFISNFCINQCAVMFSKADSVFYTPTSSGLSVDDSTLPMRVFVLTVCPLLHLRNLAEERK